MKKLALLSKVFGYLASAGVVAMMIIMVLDVIMRYFFIKPIIGATEIAQMLMVVIFLALPQATLDESHIDVDLVVSKFPQKVKAVIGIVVKFFTFCISILFTWQAFEMAAMSKLMKIAYSLIKIPEHPFYILTGLAFAAMCVVLVGHLVKGKSEVVKK
jgi:TRAP-type C4-dicarboxylate transport system permease small subunit